MKMKTPEEIKKGLAHCAANDCNDCPYQYQPDCMMGNNVLEADALAYIQQLEAAHRTEYCEDADYDCIELGKARKWIKALKAKVAEMETEIELILKRYEVLSWIGVEDALPQTGRICAVYGRGRDNRPRYDLAIMDKARTWEFGASAFEITHWMALPQPPKEEK